MVASLRRSKRIAIYIVHGVEEYTSEVDVDLREAEVVNEENKEDNEDNEVTEEAQDEDNEGTSHEKPQPSNTGATQESGQISSMTTTNLSQSFTPTQDQTPNYSPTPVKTTPNATRGNVCISVAQVREAAQQMQQGKKATTKPAWKP
ncbi:uncharacterized protein A4U43_C10F16700 [Asparagus officinalis]|uniref:Uncharacterized protein n=1 Tax=Asparagus officinalis TaxID=4686 RepID=A0A5P1E3K6_ASPOF|nr:uncharacterized protein A4U43_C10F16700 [Asparagus officinalis]